jgi:hypothetical protein
LWTIAISLIGQVVYTSLKKGLVSFVVSPIITRSSTVPWSNPKVPVANSVESPAGRETDMARFIMVCVIIRGQKTVT